jgi:hypothetical protein
MKSEFLRLTINEGPDYSPNGRRTVEVLGDSDSPGFMRCRDVRTGDLVTIDAAKLARALDEKLRSEKAKTATKI